MHETQAFGRCYLKIPALGDVSAATNRLIDLPNPTKTQITQLENKRWCMYCFPTPICIAFVVLWWPQTSRLAILCMLTLVGFAISGLRFLRLFMHRLVRFAVSDDLRQRHLVQKMSSALWRTPEMAQVFCRPSDWLDHMVPENGVFLAMHTNFVYC